MTPEADEIPFDTPKGPLRLRELRTLEEMIAAEDIQMEVWGAGVHPKEILIPIQHEGGLLAGAFTPQSELVGLIFGFPTAEAGAHHSQMLATLKAWRDAGIGTRLKWFQRDWCLKRGITRVRWTVDPLRATNAMLNIQHLGATASTYHVNYYGLMQGIDAGIPTDRLLIEWDLSSPVVAERASTTPADCPFPDAEPANTVEDGRPARPRLDLTGAQILIRIPEQFIELARTDAPLALDWRLHTRDLFLHYFAAGYAITGFTRQGGPAYRLEKR